MISDSTSIDRLYIYIPIRSLQAHGATGLQQGWIEVMLGRRCAEDGGISVDDTDHFVQQNWLFPSNTADGAVDGHRVQASEPTYY